MVESQHLLPPESGPRSDPLLFGVADALGRLFPVEETPTRTGSDAPRDDASEAGAEDARAA